jgi:hypothetical protein
MMSEVTTRKAVGEQVLKAALQIELAYTPLSLEERYAPNLCRLNRDEMFELGKIRESLVAFRRRLERPAMSNTEYYGSD